jgi:hypothetical protein
LTLNTLDIVICYVVYHFATLQKRGECFGCIGIHSFYAVVLQIAKRGSLLALYHNFSLAICKQTLLTVAQVALLSLCRFYQVLQGVVKALIKLIMTGVEDQDQ